MIALIISIIFAQVVLPTPQLPFLATPSPIPSLTPLPTQTIAVDDALDMAATEMAGANYDITRDDEGNTLLPGESYREYVGMAKWLFSLDGVQAIFGDFRLGVLGINLGALFLIALVMIAVWGVIRFVVVIVSFVLWIAAVLTGRG